MSGQIHLDLFTTLDGVAQSPGEPDEDRDSGFSFGGWQAPLIDDVDGEQVIAGIRSMDALLLGRRTYEIFADYWPGQVDGTNEIAQRFDDIPKYVASRGSPDLSWKDSHLLGPDLRTELAELRERHEEIHIIGSVDLAQSLLAANLLDQLNLWVYPIVLGAGKRLFPPDGPPESFELVSAGPASSKGTVLLRYRPKGAVPETGVMG
ncbi:dihydrofolate reductase family protein [soil metagenome]